MFKTTAAAAVALAVLVGFASSDQNPASPPAARSRERADIVVAQDGSGDFRTIQAGLDALPKDNAAHRIVLIRNGTYREKLYVTTSHVSIVGQDRDRTRIEFAELRRIWRETHPDDWGAAVVNIGDKVTDLVIANLTVHNTYGRLHGDHDHQFAIRSGGEATRITLLDANFIADGGDTVSLWNPVSGMYYHANCFFEGWVDYVCPRGWCYITNSRFFGHNLTASIWHDGSKDRDAKLVIRRSRFDGVPGFPLGRHNRDGQFFILDAVFSNTMADRPIYAAQAPDTYQWPGRYYYDNNHREGGDYAWFADNLETADRRPRAEDITPAWTFKARWDPEDTLPAVLPGAAVPQPEDGARAIDPSRASLRWIPGRNAIAHRVHLDPSDSVRFIVEQSSPRFEPGALRPGARYSWRVDEVTPGGIVRGPTWMFTTGAVGRGRDGDGQARITLVPWSACLDQPASWYGSAEAVGIARNVLLYQRRTGGWPKDIDKARMLSARDRASVATGKDLADSTIDNGATTTEIRFLARVYAATKTETVRAGVMSGLRFLLEAQYPNGGWPQFFPLRADYSRHITFNDGVMVRALRLMRDVSGGDPVFSFVDAATKTRAARAFDRGLRVILATQVRVDGTLTGWCAQYDAQTLEPRGARVYEPVSLDSRETSDVVGFLMTIDPPDAVIVEAIEGAAAWLRSVAIRGWRVDQPLDPVAPSGRDRVLVRDPSAPPLWARFYEIGTDRPIYSGRDGVIRYSLAEIEIERRAGYNWVDQFAGTLLDRDYPAWRLRQGRGAGR